MLSSLERLYAVVSFFSHNFLIKIHTKIAGELNESQLVKNNTVSMLYAIEMFYIKIRYKFYLNK